MPTRPMRGCNAPGCGKTTAGAYCPDHLKAIRQRYERTRATAAERGYGGKWQAARLAYLHEHPLCRLHEQQGQTVAALVVDHIIPHKGDLKLFWDRKNWQPLCKECHDRKTAREDGRWQRKPL